MTRAVGRRAGALLVPSLPVHRFALRCGATLLVSPRPGAQVCAVLAHVRGGHSLDPAGLEGTAYLTGRAVEEGTKGFDEEEMAAALEKHGGSLLGGATGLAGQIAGDRWKDLLEILAEGLTVPTYPRVKFERQKKRILDQLLIERDDPRMRGARLFRELVYGGHWMGRTEYGSLESVARIERRHLVRHHAQNWCGARTVVAFCGDIDPAAVKRFLDRRLAGWREGEDLQPPDTNFPALSPRVGAFRARRQQVHVFLGHLGIRRSDPDYAALVVMDHVLGTGPGFANRISRRLRDELGLAYTVHAAIHSSAGVLPGTFTAYIGTSPDRVATAVEGFLREIRRIQAELVGPDELELAKSYLTGSFALGLERTARRVLTMVSAYRNDLPEDHLRELVNAFAEVTADDVRRVACKHLHPEAPCLAAAGPIAKRELASLVGTTGR